MADIRRGRCPPDQPAKCGSLISVVILQEEHSKSVLRGPPDGDMNGGQNT